MRIRSLHIAAAGAILLGALAVAAPQNAAPQRSHDAALARNLNTFNTIVKELELNYVDSLRPDEAFKEAIDALLSTVDPYTEYYNADDQENLLKMTTGEFGGIGSYLLERDSGTYISGPMEGAPAALAGLKSGDHILRVDTTDVSRRPSSFVTKLLRGQPGTQLTVTVARPYDADSIKTFTFERAKIQEPSVPYYGVINDGKTGYVRLTSYIDKSPQEVREALESFKADPNVKSIILDLRGNGGGLIESAVDILSYFVPKGTEVVRTKGKLATQTKIYKTTRSPIFPDMPLVVLVDGGTASASEITAGALQDLDRAVLVGTRSYGKGLVQSTRPLPYNGVFKVTVAKYYIPSGRLVQALDYAHRNPDGSVSALPDSLTKVYKTLHGREVRDGGGLQPDSVVKWSDVNRLVYNVVRDNWAFDYATKFAAEHPTIAPAEEFVITDEIYDDFKKSIDPGKFKYDKVCEEAVKQLRDLVKNEGYLDDATQAQLDTLGKMLTHNLDRDLDTHRAEIEEYLGPEIVGRYYYDRGKTAYGLRTDVGVRKAEEILNTPGLYNKILGKK